MPLWIHARDTRIEENTMNATTTQVPIFDTTRYDLVALNDLKKGDVVCLPGVMCDGEVASWGTRGYTVDHVEHRAPGVVFIWRDAEKVEPGHDSFIMVCGERVEAGVLRVKGPLVNEVPAGQLQAHDVLCDDEGKPFAVVATVVGDDESGVWASTYDVTTGAPWIPLEFPAGATAVILARAT
jgi:hypothetical protein